MNKNESPQSKISFRQRIALVLFGVFLFFVLLEVSLRLGGFILLSIQEHRNLQSIKQKGTYRILCLGESTTQGEYPQFLEEALNQRNLGVRFSVVDKGMGGTNTSAILSQVESYLNEYHPDAVVTMMGCNDRRTMYYQDIPDSDTWLFRHCRVYRFSRLIYMHILKKLKKEDIYRVKSPRPNQGRSFKIERSSKNAVRLNSKDDSAYLVLGQFYRNQGRHIEAEQALKKAIDLNPKNDNAYFELGGLYRDHRKFPQAEDSFKKAIELNPKNDNAYFELGGLYRSQSKFSQAEDSFQKAIELNQNELAYGGLATVYGEMGKNKLSKAYAEKADKLRDKLNNPVTVNNYRRLKQILDKRKIKLVCVQYPMRSMEPLRRIFKGDEEGIIFVDNESVFKEALKKASYKEYFRDMFGGDFGHCTQKGNRLLAGNIANTILKEIFGK